MALAKRFSRSCLDALPLGCGLGLQFREEIVRHVEVVLGCHTNSPSAYCTAGSVNLRASPYRGGNLSIYFTCAAAEGAVGKAKSAGIPDDFEPLFRRSLELVR
jgi:hypothetical protein